MLGGPAEARPLVGEEAEQHLLGPPPDERGQLVGLDVAALEEQHAGAARRERGDGRRGGPVLIARQHAEPERDLLDPLLRRARGGPDGAAGLEVERSRGLSLEVEPPTEPGPRRQREQAREGQLGDGAASQLGVRGEGAALVGDVRRRGAVRLALHPLGQALGKTLGKALGADRLERLNRRLAQRLDPAADSRLVPRRLVSPSPQARPARVASRSFASAKRASSASASARRRRSSSRSRRTISISARALSMADRTWASASSCACSVARRRASSAACPSAAARSSRVFSLASVSRFCRSSWERSRSDLRLKGLARLLLARGRLLGLSAPLLLDARLLLGLRRAAPLLIRLAAGGVGSLLLLRRAARRLGPPALLVTRLLLRLGGAARPFLGPPSLLFGAALLLLRVALRLLGAKPLLLCPAVLLIGLAARLLRAAPLLLGLPGGEPALALLLCPALLLLAPPLLLLGAALLLLAGAHLGLPLALLGLAGGARLRDGELLRLGALRGLHRGAVGLPHAGLLLGRVGPLGILGALEHRLEVVADLLEGGHGRLGLGWRRRTGRRA